MFEPWICRDTLTGGEVGVASAVGVDRGVIAANGDGFSFTAHRVALGSSRFS